MLTCSGRAVSRARLGLTLNCNDKDTANHYVCQGLVNLS